MSDVRTVETNLGSNNEGGNGKFHGGKGAPFPEWQIATELIVGQRVINRLRRSNYF